MAGWPRSVLISSLIALFFLTACGVKGPPASPSGPWGPQQDIAEEPPQPDNQPD